MEGHSYLGHTGEAESPFLHRQELFAHSATEEFEPRAAALVAQSPFAGALDERPNSFDEDELNERGALGEFEEAEELEAERLWEEAEEVLHTAEADQEEYDSDDEVALFGEEETELEAPEDIQRAEHIVDDDTLEPVHGGLAEAREVEFHSIQEGSPLRGEENEPALTGLVPPLEEIADHEIQGGRFAYEEYEEQELAGDVSGDSADTTVGYEQALIDPVYRADPGDEPSEIWAYAQRLREIIERRGDPSFPDRRFLTVAVLNQLQTLGLYREIKLARSAVKQSGTKPPLDLYVLLFPGEGRDNTGIKDLNDKVLGYKITSDFIKKRQKAIATLFWDVATTGPRYVNVGQDYKTASIVAYGKARQNFADDLVKLDAQLRQDLLDSLDKAEKDPADDKQRAEITKLKIILEKDKKYKFDFLFGAFSFDPTQNRSEIDATFLVLTQALKGAGIGRFVSKASTQKSKEARKVALGTGVKQDAKKLDIRGKAFGLDAYRKTTNAADRIKTFMSTPYNRDRPYDYINILVDQVWDWAFLYYRKLWSGNPDVIRDARKKLLVPPKVKQGVKYTFKAQVELLELWLVALNELDFVKDFLLSEFRKELVIYHELCYAAFTQLRDLRTPIDWNRLEKILTHDLRLTERPVIVQGTTSEYQFYAYSADHDQQIVFTMDVRDLGVEVALWYELSSWIILEDKLSDIKLLEETIESTKPIVQRKRATYDAVVAIMAKYFNQLRLAPAKGELAAQKAFETGVRARAFPPNFKEAVQVMLGGDEVFVAAHPYFAHHVVDIINCLEKATFRSDSHGRDLGDRPLNMRVSVAYSSATIAAGGAAGATPSPAQRLENQVSHGRALRLGSSASGALKTYERTHRRIERLIELIEANQKKKAKQAPPFRDRLAKLGLLRLFVQVQYAHTATLSMAKYERLLAALDAGDLVAAQGMKLIDIVDHSGNVVDVNRLKTDMAKLEADVTKIVGIGQLPPGRSAGRPKDQEDSRRHHRHHRGKEAIG